MLLDIGCADGTVTTQIIEKIGKVYQLEVTGIETSTELIKSFKSRTNYDINFINNNVESMDKLPKSDFILIAHVVCYIKNLESFLEKVINSLNTKGIDLFSKPKNMSDILSNNYNFYIYDYGALNEMTEEEKMSFLTRDLKLVVSGNKLWELTNLINTFQIIGTDINTYLVFNFAKESEKENFRISLGEYWKERTTFSEYVTEPFEVKNKYFFENILKPYLINTDVTEKKKMFDWFKKRGRR